VMKAPTSMLWITRRTAGQYSKIVLYSGDESTTSMARRLTVSKVDQSVMDQLQWNFVEISRIETRISALSSVIQRTVELGDPVVERLVSRVGVVHEQLRA
jgi:hypothetical protein